MNDISWNHNSCKKEALKYSTRTEWHKHSQSSYQAARIHGWLENCCSHMKIYGKKHTLEECKNDALKYNSRGSWYKNSKIFYSYAHKNGW